jgi:hypothetical protein
MHTIDVPHLFTSPQSQQGRHGRALLAGIETEKFRKKSEFFVASSVSLA